jgi:hypothetical protein
MRLPIALPIHISILLLPPQQKALLFVVGWRWWSKTPHAFLFAAFSRLFLRAQKAFRVGLMGFD